MASLQIRNIETDIVLALKNLATTVGERGVEPYVRNLLKSHVQKMQFLADIESCQALVQKEYNGILPTKSEELLREERYA